MINRKGLLRWARVRLTPLLLSVVCTAASASGGDERFLAARDAARSGDKAKLAQLAAANSGGVLDAYIEYWYLKSRLDELPPETVLDFINRNSGSYLAERLRGDWLKQLARIRDWPTFDQYFRDLADPDQETRCLSLHSRVLGGDSEATARLKAMWLDADIPDSCHQAMLALIVDGRVQSDESWERLRRLAEGRRTAAAKAIVAWLPPGEQPDAKALDLAINEPLRYLDRQRPNFSTMRVGRELAMIAVARLARSDAAAAAARWQSMAQRFSSSERGWVSAFIAAYGAQQHESDAVKWFKAAGDTPLTEDQRAWKVRAGLRALDWRFVRAAIEAMPEGQRGEPPWTYWRGRADLALGEREDAVSLFQSISGQPNFYGNLADDELGRGIVPPERAEPPAMEDLVRAASNDSIKRALALFKLGPDSRMDAIREWNWALRGQDDHFLLAAADLAQRNEIWDRAISSADRTTNEHNYDLRYLAPFKEFVAPRATELGLDPAWVYGLMRQESRFITNARSNVGAQGLMQVMPSTAKWVANKIGWREYRPTSIADLDTNVTLGTNYLRIVLDDLDNLPVLASAAYNAGPGRARKWRDDVKPLEGAIYAETIPFSETRDYVKKVMSNAVYYAALFEGKPQSLKRRLGVVQPRNGVEPVSDTP